MDAEKTPGYVANHVEEQSTSSNEEITWTEAEETAIRHKLDWQIVPIVTLMYLLCFLDRANIGNARIQGMAKDLHLVGYRFNIASSVFYVVYLLVEVPSNIILKRVGPRFYLPALVVGFGFVSMCTAWVKDFEQLCVARAFLGVFEGGVHTWRNIFFFEGLITIFVGFVAPFIMPSSPSTSARLTEREKWIAAERLRLEHRADPNENVNIQHIKKAVFNINNYVCAGGFFCINITVQGLSIFMPTVLNDLGWTATKAQLYTVPVYVSASVVAILVGFLSDKTRMRGIWLAGFTFLGIAGFSILRWNTDENIRYMAVYFCAVGAFPGGPGFLSWGLNNSAGPAVRAVSSGWIVTLGTIGGIVATWSYLVKDAPKYPIGHSINLSAQVVVLALASFGIVYCKWENRVRARGGRDHRLQGLSEQEKLDLGHHHPDFRYMA
ncbi:hypothetical protein LTR64_006469 [Lithohypha guttulata]|uniref:uncharacterized protein n=1 Tax=Lithohypha guttulata TaxID=1690604 RepID=UPI002DE1709C|nr:hypothetical protein LTR51_004973 [Lithohypha guttulata]